MENGRRGEPEGSWRTAAAENNGITETTEGDSQKTDDLRKNPAPRAEEGAAPPSKTENRTADFRACPVVLYFAFPAAPEWGFPGAGSVSIHFAHTYAKMEPVPGKFSEEGGSEGGRLFQEAPSLRGLLPGELLPGKPTAAVLFLPRTA